MIKNTLDIPQLETISIKLEGLELVYLSSETGRLTYSPTYNLHQEIRNTWDILSPTEYHHRIYWATDRIGRYNELFKDWRWPILMIDAPNGVNIGSYHSAWEYDHHGSLEEGLNDTNKVKHLELYLNHYETGWTLIPKTSELFAPVLEEVKMIRDAFFAPEFNISDLMLNIPV
jgi:hypothetical protein